MKSRYECILFPVDIFEKPHQYPASGTFVIDREIFGATVGCLACISMKLTTENLVFRNFNKGWGIHIKL